MLHWKRLKFACLWPLRWCGLEVVGDVQERALSVRSQVRVRIWTHSSAAQDLLVSLVGMGSYGLPWSPCTTAGPRTQQVGSYYGHAQVGFPRWSTPYPFFFQLKKKFARLYKVEVYIHFDHRRSDFLREKKKVRQMEHISFVKFIIFMKGYYWYFLPINYCLGSP